MERAARRQALNYPSNRELYQMIYSQKLKQLDELGHRHDSRDGSASEDLAEGVHEKLTRIPKKISLEEDDGSSAESVEEIAKQQEKEKESPSPEKDFKEEQIDELQ